MTRRSGYRCEQAQMVATVDLDRDASLPTRRVNGRLTVRVVRGCVRTHALGRTFDMSEGSLLTLARNVPHDITAMAESVVVLTVTWAHDA